MRCNLLDVESLRPEARVHDLRRKNDGDDTCQFSLLTSRKGPRCIKANWYVDTVNGKPFVNTRSVARSDPVSLYVLCQTQDLLES